MCNRHSFIVTRAGKVFDGLGLTDSHTTIRELCCLHANDDTVNAYEWQPPKGWPDADWEGGLTKDTEVFEPKVSHLRAMERHIKKIYPNMDAWNTPDRFRAITSKDLVSRGWVEVESGSTISPSKTDKLFITSGEVYVLAQSGGYCWALNSATLNASAQSGGDCRAYDSATLNKI